MNIVATVLQILLGLFFLAAGGSKIAGAKPQIESFHRWRLPQWFRPIVGTVEVLGGIGLLVGVAVHWVGTLAALGLCGVMLGALLTHTRIRDTPRAFIPAGVLLCVSAILVALRWTSLAGHSL